MEKININEKKITFILQLTGLGKYRCVSQTFFGENAVLCCLAPPLSIMITLIEHRPSAFIINVVK